MSKKKKSGFETAEPGSEYSDTDELRKIFEDLKGQKFMLDCGY